MFPLDATHGEHESPYRSTRLYPARRLDDKEAGCCAETAIFIPCVGLVSISGVGGSGYIRGTWRHGLICQYHRWLYLGASIETTYSAPTELSALSVYLPVLQRSIATTDGCKDRLRQNT